MKKGGTERRGFREKKRGGSISKFCGRVGR